MTSGHEYKVKKMNREEIQDIVNRFEHAYQKEDWKVKEHVPVEGHHESKVRSTLDGSGQNMNSGYGSSSQNRVSNPGGMVTTRGI